MAKERLKTLQMVKKVVRQKVNKIFLNRLVMKEDAQCWREAITRSMNPLRHIVEQNVILQPSLLKIASFSYSTSVYATESMKYGMSNLKCLSSVLILSVLVLCVGKKWFTRNVTGVFCFHERGSSRKNASALVWQEQQMLKTTTTLPPEDVIASSGKVCFQCRSVTACYLDSAGTPMIKNCTPLTL